MAPAPAWPRSLLGVLALLLLLLLPKHVLGNDIWDEFQEEDEDDTVPVESVEAVLDGKTTLPCSIDSPNKNDRANMVLWFRNATGKPIYIFDVRNRPYNNAHVSSDPAWLGGRAHFATSERGELGKSSGPAQLSLDKVQLTDAGIYRCRVDFKSSRTANYKVNLTVIVPPSQLKLYDSSGTELKNGVVGPVREGRTLVLKCEVRGGQPPPTITWFVNDRVQDGFMEKDADNVRVSVLTEPAVTKHQLNNTYRCQASNTKLRHPTERTVRLEMHLKPDSVRIQEKPIQLIAARETTLTCDSRGSRPQAKLTWMRGKELYNRGSVFNTSTEALVSSRLKFVPQPEDHGVVMSCLAENRELLPSRDAHKSDNFTLNVVYKPIVSLKLGPSLNPDNIKQGDDTYFECDILANPQYRHISWYHNGDPVTQNATARVVLSTQSLVMQGVTRAHAGNYTCKASNEQGESLSKPVPLRVQYAPVCRFSSPVVVGASLDESVQVHCAVDADPSNVTFVWKLANSGESFEIAPNRAGPHNATTSELSYVPKSERDYGTLTCWGRNSVGQQTEPCVFHVIPAMKPGPLNNCTLRAGSANGSSLQLLAPVSPGTSNAIPPSPPPSSGMLDIKCVAGPDGGLTQTFHLEAYESRTMNLRYNVSSPEPDFRLDSAQFLPARTATLHLAMFASNAKGRGPLTTFEDITVRTKERHIEYMGDDQGMGPGTMYTLVGVTALSLVLSLILFAVVLFRRRHGHGSGGSGIAKSNRHGNQLDIKHGDQCYIVSYTLKSSEDCASKRKPDILETPRGNEPVDIDSFGNSGAQRPESLFGGIGPSSRGMSAYLHQTVATRELPAVPTNHKSTSSPIAQSSPLSGGAPGLGILAACPPEPLVPPPQPIYATHNNHKPVPVGNGTLRASREPRESRDILRDSCREESPVLPPSPHARILPKERVIADSIPGPESCV